MKKNEIKVWEDRLEISKIGTNYMITDKVRGMFIHADKLSFNKFDTTIKGQWLNFYNKEAYIGSVWIDTDTDIETVKKFLGETK